MTRARFARFAWAVLAYNLAVIMWGVLVRATDSGAGCGDHWPLCDGAAAASPSFAHIVELTHRISVGIGIALVSLLVLGAFRIFPRKHRVRLAAVIAFSFTMSEAVIGAALVLYKLVQHNPSIYRAVALSGHLSNTFILLAGLTLTAWWASGAPAIRLRQQGDMTWALLIALAGAMLLGISGTVAALGDTLYPAHSLAQALQQDLSPTATVLIRLRLLHPLIALSVGLYLLLTAGLVSHLRPSEATQKYSGGIVVIFLIQMCLGITNVLLQAPIWMQLAHLLVADLLWIDLVLLSAAALAEGVPHRETSRRAADPAGHHPAGWRDYVALTKPRVISLLLLTTLAAMYMAGRPSLCLVLAVAGGGYLAAGAANTFNMVIDRDIDGVMVRTQQRPVVTDTITSLQALRFAFMLEVVSFTLLWAAANLLTAVLALAGLAVYVLVYTLGLKRRTWHNIVIGGAAGAFPPLVGWAAVAGHLDLMAWCLFAIIFVWTPVHFWALALLIKDDYASVGVPMLPVVRGDRVTVVQILGYAVLTCVVSMAGVVVLIHTAAAGGGWLPASIGGLVSTAAGKMDIGLLACAAVLNVLLLARSYQLCRTPDRPRASSLFHYSMAYLALLFVLMAIGHAAHL
ncbi:MAG: heme o synthase [Armatimonadetes bacterium]|nr:heme o synthase [Armatimonadota bacterium]MDE2206826.1 heme o synthase [Armatimonadota bacterium]